MAATESTRARVLAVKVEIDWSREADKGLYRRLRDLGWMAAHYRNCMVRALWAASAGYRVDPTAVDKNDIAKKVRKEEKGELSGDVYSCCEQEVQGAWSRDAKKILAGQPLPEWKPTAALCISGKEKKQDSGIRLEMENDQYVLRIRAQSKDCDGGCWLRVPIAKNVRRDEYQGDVLNAMVSGAIPIKKATMQIKQHGIIARFTYKDRALLPPMGSRVATIGPVNREGRVLLRTETQTKDYTSKLAQILTRKDDWDLIRRRVTCQIGRRKGHARLKRERLSRVDWSDWLHTHLHTWTREVVEWCKSQGVGTIRVLSLETKDWPAYKFVQLLTYKAEDAGITVSKDADISEAATERSAKAALVKEQRSIKRRREAVRELIHQIGA